MSCQLKHKDSKSNTKEVMLSNGAIDNYYNIIDLPTFRAYNSKLSALAESKYGTSGRLYLEEKEGKVAIPNTSLFNRIDKVRKELGLYESQSRLVKDAPVESTDSYHKDGKAKDIVESISTAGGKYAILANQLKSKIGDVKVEFIEKDSEKYLKQYKVLGHDFSGLYLNTEDVIYVVKDGSINYDKTILHEVIHHLTYNEIRKNPDEITSLYQKVLTEFEKNGIDTDIYALKNVDEFMVGLFLDFRLIDGLSKIPAETNKPSLYIEILNYIKDLLGLESDNTLFNEVFSTASTYLSDRSFEYFSFESLSNSEFGNKNDENLISFRENLSDNYNTFGVLYHGTSNNDISNLILPPTSTNVISEKGRKKNLDQVFYTKSKKYAEIYAGRSQNENGGDKKVYSIVPVGKVTILNSTPGSEVYHSDYAIVVDENENILTQIQNATPHVENTFKKIQSPELPTITLTQEQVEMTC